MTLAPNFWSTHVGSLPHVDPDLAGVCSWLVETLDVPAWPQFPKRTYTESMYVQYGLPLPNATLDSVKEKLVVDTTSDLTGPLEVFYERYLADDLDYFALRPEHAAGFFALLDALDSADGKWVKGQVTGPISFGLTVTDQNLRSVLYNDLLVDAIVKNAAMNARWQIRQLRPHREHVILFVDEPYMASFGSAFISLSREQAIGLLDEVFDAIHAEGAVSGVHCCANTDWSVLLATKVDILNLDAYGYLDNLALYPAELCAFLGRGGAICWGVVPNTEDIFRTTPEGLADRLRQGFATICEKAANRGVDLTTEQLRARSLIAPACGLGPATEAVAQASLEMTAAVSELLRAG